MIQCGIISINLFKNYFSMNDFNDSENPCQNSVTYITHHTERKGPRYGILLLKSQNNLNKKGPLEVIYSNLQFKAGIIRPGCSGTCLVESWMFPRPEIPQNLNHDVRKIISFKLQLSNTIIPPLQYACYIYYLPQFLFLIAVLLRLQKIIWWRNSLQKLPSAYGADMTGKRTGSYLSICHLSQNIFYKKHKMRQYVYIHF